MDWNPKISLSEVIHVFLILASLGYLYALYMMTGLICFDQCPEGNLFLHQLGLNSFTIPVFAYYSYLLSKRLKWFFAGFVGLLMFVAWLIFNLYLTSNSFSNSFLHNFLFP